MGRRVETDRSIAIHLETLHESLNEMVQVQKEQEVLWKEQIEMLEKRVAELQGRLSKVNEDYKYLDRDRNQQLAVMEHDLMKRSSDLDK